MYSNSRLVRVSDDKLFKVVNHGHWSDIRAEDGETDYIKWYGGGVTRELYVSANRGHTYIWVKDFPDTDPQHTRIPE